VKRKDDAQVVLIASKVDATIAIDIALSWACLDGGVNGANLP
jgi:hypothetical protein